MKKKGTTLQGEEVSGEELGSPATLGGGQVADQAGESRLWGAEGCDVVPMVVLVFARGLVLAARDGGLREFWVFSAGEEHLDAAVVIWVDDGRDVEVGGVIVGIEVDLAQDAGHISSTVVIRIEVSLPCERNCLVG